MAADERDDDRTESAGNAGDRLDRPRMDRLGHFRIEAVLGSGGMGTIYRAYDESMKRTVALKVLHSSLGISERAQSRFVREAWIAGQLDHPNIVKVYSRGEEKDVSYLAMELAEGGSLDDSIKQVRGHCPTGKDITETIDREYINETIIKFIELADALGHIHAKGFIHRDIKPHNILLAGVEEKFKFTDFGIAHADSMTKMTRAGDFMGTIRYMSPELISAHRATVDSRSDIYSLGVTLYETLCLTLPVRADSDEAYIGLILAGHHTPIRKQNSRIPRALETVIMKATHVDPGKRYQTAHEFGADLRRCLENRPVMARRERLVARSWKLVKRNKVSAYTLVTSLAIVAMGFTFYRGWHARQADTLELNRTLEAAIETGASPSDLSPVWGRLSRVLRETLEKGKRDTTFRLYCRYLAVPDFTFSPTVILGKFDVTAQWMSKRIIEGDWSDHDSTWLFVSTVSATVNDVMPDYPQTLLAGRLISPEVQYVTVGISNREEITESGEYLIELCFISQVFDGADIYRAASNEDKGQDTALVIASNGDTLKGPLVGHHTLGGFDASQYRVLDSRLAIAEPIYTDTVTDTCTIFNIGQYPDDIPELVHGYLTQVGNSRSIRIDKIEVVKYADSAYLSRVYFHSSHQMDTAISAEFSVTDSKTKDSLMWGSLLWSIYDQKPNVFFLNSSSTSYTSSIEGVAEKRFWGTHHVNMPDRVFSLGSVEATLTLYPSKEVVRRSEINKIYRVWGDTLTFDVLFTAIDSSSVELTGRPILEP